MLGLPVWGLFREDLPALLTRNQGVRGLARAHALLHEVQSGEEASLRGRGECAVYLRLAAKSKNLL